MIEETYIGEAIAIAVDTNEVVHLNKGVVTSDSQTFTIPNPNYDATLYITNLHANHSEDNTLQVMIHSESINTAFFARESRIGRVIENVACVSALGNGHFAWVCHHNTESYLYVGIPGMDDVQRYSIHHNTTYRLWDKPYTITSYMVNGYPIITVLYPNSHHVTIIDIQEDTARTLATPSNAVITHLTRDNELIVILEDGVALQYHPKHDVDLWTECGKVPFVFVNDIDAFHTVDNQLYVVGGCGDVTKLRIDDTPCAQEILDLSTNYNNVLIGNGFVIYDTGELLGNPPGSVEEFVKKPITM